MHPVLLYPIYLLQKNFHSKKAYQSTNRYLNEIKLISLKCVSRNQSDIFERYGKFELIIFLSRDDYMGQWSRGYDVELRIKRSRELNLFVGVT